ncbi:MAG: SxtJ family membrane protein, partial [Alphaproteobacteria bacterium]
NRTFGLVMAGALLLVGLWPLASGEVPRTRALVPSALLLAAALVRPRLLAPLNWAWTRFGLVLHHVTNPLVMGALFYLVIVPAGLIMRALGRDPLKRAWQPECQSYWIAREPPGPAPETMRNQF